MAISLFLNVSIIIEKCTFLPSINQPAITIWPINQETHSGKFVSIDECTFLGLKFGAISISSYDSRSLSIKITNSVLRNTSKFNNALTIVKKLPDVNDQLTILIENTTFIHNNHSSLYVSQVNNLTLAGNQFIDNYETTIVCEGSKIYFSGTTHIKGNKGSRGGALFLSPAIYLYRRSNKWEASPPLLYFQPEARLILENNHATDKGGGIYVDSSSLQNLFSISKQAVSGDYFEPCFYQLVSSTKFVTRLLEGLYMPKIVFVNNTAGFAGDSIFGGLYKYCILKMSLRTRINFEDFIIFPNHQAKWQEIQI